MKNPTYLIILLAIGLVFVSYRWVTSSVSSPEDLPSPTATVLDNIMTRTSVRSYSEQPVSDEQIDTLLRAAMAAPTAGNKQPWRFVVIRDTATMNYISQNFHTMTMMSDAKAAIVVCGDTTATFSGEAVEYWVQDASAATENLLLAAHGMGLGAVWCGVYPKSDRVKIFSELLRLPSHILPLNCIAIGYPEGETTPKDKWHPEYIHYDAWTGASTTDH